MQIQSTCFILYAIVLFFVSVIAGAPEGVNNAIPSLTLIDNLGVLGVNRLPVKTFTISFTFQVSFSPLQARADIVAQLEDTRQNAPYTRPKSKRVSFSLRFYQQFVELLQSINSGASVAFSVLVSPILALSAVIRILCDVCTITCLWLVTQSILKGYQHTDDTIDEVLSFFDVFARLALLVSLGTTDDDASDTLGDDSEARVHQATSQVSLDSAIAITDAGSSIFHVVESLVPVDTEIQSNPTVYDNGVLTLTWYPETSTSTWSSAVPDVPQIIIHHALEENSEVASLVWTPLQAGQCGKSSQHRLFVPGSFVLDNPAPHPNCSSCFASASLMFRQRCLERTGEEASDLVMGSIDAQRELGLHARCWVGEFGVCNCPEWKAYDSTQLEAQEECESDAGDEETVVGSPYGSSTLQLPTIDDKDAGKTMNEPCTVVTVEWGTYDDVEELPDLSDW